MALCGQPVVVAAVCLALVLSSAVCGDETGPEEDQPRKISVDLNPGCGDPYTCDNTTSLLHIRSLGAKDELHFLWDFLGKPGLLLLQFDRIAEPVDMTVDWRQFLAGEPSIAFSRAPKYYFGLVLQNLWLYDDLEADLKNADPERVVSLPLANFFWERQALNVSESHAEVTVTAHRMLTAEGGAATRRQRKGGQPQSAPRSRAQTADVGSVTLTFGTSGEAGHSAKIPHLLHTENATEIDLVLKDVHVAGRNFSCPRTALGVTVVAMNGAGGGAAFSLNTRRSIDDEFTPGIFELINLSSRGLSRQGEGFVQYRPVSYTNAEREVSTSTLVKQTPPEAPEDLLETLSETIFAAVAEVKIPQLLVRNMNVSFGVKGDGCYDKTNYTTWTFIAANGQPMPERLSTMVVILAAFGLGLPLVLLISCGCFVCLRKARSS